jgi:hypothetical protein
VAKLDQNWIKKMELVQAGGKGKVAIYNRDGLYWLRWSYRGRRYSLAVGHSQIKPTRALAAKIETDMASGHFDSSLNAYRPKVDQKLDQSPPVLSVQALWHLWSTGDKRGQAAQP